MEDIRKNLRDDYTISVERYNAKDYKNFFRNIRPTIEWLSKLLIYDFMREDDLAKEIINGEKTLELQPNKLFKLKESKGKHYSICIGITIWKKSATGSDLRVIAT